MSAPGEGREEDRASSRVWRGQIGLLVLGGLITLVVSVAISTGGRVISGGETSAELRVQVGQLIKQNDDLKKGNDDQNKLLMELSRQAGNLYTRDEARADREAMERRFQSMEGRIGDLSRRLEIVEANQRFMQQFVTDRIPTRKP